jgi:hypothetical protein
LALAKKYIKKYGISKKAWAAQRAAQKKKPKRRVATRAKTTRRRKSTKKTTKKTNKRRQSNMFNFGGGLGKGIAVGVAAGVVNRFIPVNIAGADLIIAGMVMKDSTVQKIGAITLGRSLAASFTGLATGGNGGGFGGY